MKKLLELDNDVLLTGRSRSRHVAKGGIWDTAPGLNPFIENDTYRGLVAFAATPTRVGSGTITDIPVGYTKKEDGSGASDTIYLLANNSSATTGTIYSVAWDGTSHTVTSLHTLTNPRNGIIYWGPKGGAALTYYALEGKIGTYNGTTFTDTAYDPLTFADDRPFHSFFDRFYYGNVNAVGGFKDDGSGGVIHDAAMLDLPSIARVKALADDGRYLVIGTTNIGSSLSTSQNISKVLFWDTNSDSWSWETDIPSTKSIRGMYARGSVVYIVTSQEVYTVIFGEAPQLLYTFDSDEEIGLSANGFTGSPQCITAFQDGILFGSKGTAIAEPYPGYTRAIYNPIALPTAGAARVWIPNFINKRMYFGTDQGELYFTDLTSAGASVSGVATRNIAFPTPVFIERLDITLPNGIGAGQYLTLSLVGDDLNSVSLPLISTSTYPGNTFFLSLSLPKPLACTRVKLEVLGNSSTPPSFSSIAFWGTDKGI